MCKTRYILSVIVALLLQSCFTAVQPGPTVASLESEVRERSRGVAAAEAAKDVPAIMAFWTPDAVLHIEGAAPIKGEAAIRDWYVQIIPSVQSFLAEISDIEVSRSGDLAYESGTNYLTLTTPQGPASGESKYLAVWRRGSDGQWRVTAISVTNNPKQ